MDKIKVVWREYYNDAAVKALEKMGTLPRNETMVDSGVWDCGDEIAAAVAKAANEEDSESFREGGEIVIIEPAEFAGTFEISVEYVPYFSAFERFQ